MRTFGIPPCREIGTIKDAIKDAILDGAIPNDRHAAWQMMLEKAAELGLEPVGNPTTNATSSQDSPADKT